MSLPMPVFSSTIVSSVCVNLSTFSASGSKQKSVCHWDRERSSNTLCSSMEVLPENARGKLRRKRNKWRIEQWRTRQIRKGDCDVDLILWRTLNSCSSIYADRNKTNFAVESVHERWGDFPFWNGNGLEAIMSHRAELRGNFELLNPVELRWSARLAKRHTESMN